MLRHTYRAEGKVHELVLHMYTCRRVCVHVHVCICMHTCTWYMYMVERQEHRGFDFRLRQLIFSS